MIVLKASACRLPGLQFAHHWNSSAVSLIMPSRIPFHMRDQPTHLRSHYGSHTFYSRFAIKRFTHGRRMQLALTLVSPQPGESILDVGTGDGAFPLELVRLRPWASVVAQDPMSHMVDQARVMCGGYSQIAVSQVIPDLAFDWVTCFEVLEHLPPDTVADLLSQMRSVLKPHGQIVVSVPIEVGLAGAIKNLIRYGIGQSHPSPLKDMARAALGLPVCRTYDGGYCGSHVGFDYRALPPAFKNAGLEIERVIYSPIPAIGYFLNSQVFWVLRYDGRGEP